MWRIPVQREPAALAEVAPPATAARDWLDVVRRSRSWADAPARGRARRARARDPRDGRPAPRCSPSPTRRCARAVTRRSAEYSRAPNASTSRPSSPPTNRVRLVKVLVDDAVALTDLVRLLVHPRQARAAEHEEDLLGLTVDVRRGRHLSGASSMRLAPSASYPPRHRSRTTSRHLPAVVSPLLRLVPVRDPQRPRLYATGAARADAQRSTVICARSSPSRLAQASAAWTRPRSSSSRAPGGAPSRSSSSIRSSRASTARASSMSTKLAGGSARVCDRGVESLCRLQPEDRLVERRDELRAVAVQQRLRRVRAARRRGRDRRRVAPAARRVRAASRRAGSRRERPRPTARRCRRAARRATRAAAPPGTGRPGRATAPSGRSPRRARDRRRRCPSSASSPHGERRAERVEARRLADRLRRGDRQHGPDSVRAPVEPFEQHRPGRDRRGGREADRA